jgi:FAD/FMN-containing dehydrogenase
MSIHQQNATNQAAKLNLEAIRSRLAGRLITAEDEVYEKARTIFYGGIDRRPSLIIQPANAQDIAYAISLAREAGLEIAVKSGGHSMAGFGTSDGGLVIDLSLMKGMDIDPKARTAWAETGLTAGEYTREAGKYGLATGFGDTGSVGIGGITLGGGIGFFARKFGMTIDDLLAAEIVTADGQILHVDEEHHPELFWALRGGGGNFGVVTRFKFRLHEVRNVIGGMLFLPASPEILLKLVELADAAPEELTMLINVMTAPPMPFLPSEYHGKLITFIMPLYTGDTETGEKVLAPIRAVATPIVDMLKPMAYPEIYPDEEDYHPTAAGRNLFLDTLNEEDAKTIFEQIGKSDAMMAVTQVRVLGGAMARVPNNATAFAHRKRNLMLQLAALYTNPNDAEKYELWVSNFASMLQKGSSAAAYVNFVGNEGEARLREIYPVETWERLRAVKAEYDPENLFHLNQNIPPAGK